MVVHPQHPRTGIFTSPSLSPSLFPEFAIFWPLWLSIPLPRCPSAAGAGWWCSSSSPRTGIFTSPSLPPSLFHRIPRFLASLAQYPLAQVSLPAGAGRDGGAAPAPQDRDFHHSLTRSVLSPFLGHPPCPHPSSAGPGWDAGASQPLSTPLAAASGSSHPCRASSHLAAARGGPCPFSCQRTQSIPKQWPSHSPAPRLTAFYRRNKSQGLHKSRG